METKEKELSELRKEVFKSCETLDTVRSEIKRFLDDKIQEVLSAFSNEERILITFDELKLFELGKRNEGKDGVYFEKTQETENKIVFLTFMIDGSGYGLHAHDCFEITKVIKGILLERTKQKSYGEGEMICYAPNEYHRPYAGQESLYEVTFIKNLN